MKTLKKGMEVKVFEDPLTEQKMEGKAILLKKQDRVYPTTTLEYWKVKFKSDGFIADRFIKP